MPGGDILDCQQNFISNACCHVLCADWMLQSPARARTCRGAPVSARSRLLSQLPLTICRLLPTEARVQPRNPTPTLRWRSTGCSPRMPSLPSATWPRLSSPCQSATPTRRGCACGWAFCSRPRSSCGPSTTGGNLVGEATPTSVRSHKLAPAIWRRSPPRQNGQSLACAHPPQ